MAKTYTCIVCPKGCHITVNDDGSITGYTCLRGLNYVKQESVDPRRTITSSIVISNRLNEVVSVKTSNTIPKAKMFEVMEEIQKKRVEAPIKMNQVLIENVLNLGVDVIATKEID